ncbi:hypothetical protein ACRRTK_009662 [Alexandromys fortis]
MNKDTLTESRSKTTGKSDEHPNLWIERFFNRRCCITFLTGCYSCHWQYREWEKTELGSCCCPWKEQFFYMCLVVAFVLSVIFLFVWVETSNEYNGFDWVVYLGSKRWFLWSIFMLSIAGILTAYTSLLLVFVFLVILLCSFLLYVLNRYWTDKWLIAGLSLQPSVWPTWNRKLAPENTMMSFEKAVEHGASGLETDVYLSYDAVPFLMHDYDLSRTTNIREVLPSAAFNHTATFSWTFLSTLNAGQWFIQHKPFFGMKPLSEADKRRASNQSIPSLAELLELAKNEKKFLIFDLFGPPPKHPLRNTFVRRVVKVILDSNIEQHLIFWLPGYDRDYVRFKAPGFQHVGRLRTLEELAKENMTIVNVDYKRLFYQRMVRQYQAAKIHINMYIVNEPWLFSLAWCNRINSVTTDNIQVLNQLSHPLFFMTPGYYTFIWLFMVIASAIIIGVVFYYHWVKELKKEKWLKDTTSASAAPNERPMPFKNTVKPLMLTENFQHTQTPTREPSSENTLPTLKEDELEGAFTEESHAKTDPKTPVSDSSEGSYEPLDGTISTISDKISLKQE